MLAKITQDTEHISDINKGEESVIGSQNIPVTMWACDPSITSSILQSYHVAGPLFAQALQSFFAAQCAMTGNHLWPTDATHKVIQDPNYDFIVIGAGSAGSVVANRLSEIPDWKVLLVEAGGNPTLAVQMPQLFYNNLNTPEDWGYKTEPQEGICRSYKDKRCAWPRGKTLGGSSSINAMFYVRGNKADYDEWEAAGNKGWSYEDVLPYFKKSEHLLGNITDELRKYHGEDGYLYVNTNDDVHDFEELMINAGVEVGIQHNTDINGPSQMGITVSSTNIKNGIRQSTARTFLNACKDRNNLHVIKNAHATKILFKPGTNKVSGILLSKDGKEYTVNIKKELIVSGGAINSPQLLMLSGIGPRKHLEELGIEVKADLPVGDNLEDHVFVPIFFKSPGDESMTSLPNIIQGMIMSIMKGEGPLAVLSPHRVISFINTTDPFSESPDFQYHYIFFPPSITNLLDFLNKHGLSEEVQNKFRIMNKNQFTLLVYNTLLKPKSKGRILLRSKDPFEHPAIYANYFNDPDDLKTMINGIKYALKLDKTKAFEVANFRHEWLDIEACRGHKKDSDEMLECMIREMPFSLYHPTSTVKMGPDNDKSAVVDPQLRVRGIEKLRVIDASIMPSVIRGNTNAPCIMIGEKGSDILKEYWLKKHTEL